MEGSLEQASFQGADRPRAQLRRPAARPVQEAWPSLAGFVFALFALLSSAAPAASQILDQNLWATDGAVDAIARSGNTIYVGGSFTKVGPNTGGGVPIDGATGAAITPYPRVAGVVHAVVPDGGGGWYIGGSFAAVGGLPRRNLAHILATGEVSNWDPSADGEILALSRIEATLYVAGLFSHVGGQARSFIAALDATSGDATTWDPKADARVRALLVNGSRLFAGGDFAVIGDSARNSVAELDVVTGVATTWNPDVGWYGMPGSVRALAAEGDTLYVGGDFASVGGQPRLLIAAVDAATGAPAAWNPSATGPDDAIYGNPYVGALEVRGGTAYVGGHFTAIGGQVRGGLAAVELADGAVTAWDPNPGPWTPGSFNRDVTALALRDSTVFVAGYFESMGGELRSFAAEVNLRTGAPTGWNLNANGVVKALAIDGGVVYVGGDFTGLGPQWQKRRNIAAFDAITGAVKQWNPDPDGYGIWSLALSPGRVYVGGYFSTIGGQARFGLAALDTLDGASTDWNPTADNIVASMQVAGDNLYVGGSFATMAGQVRNRLASFDLRTGDLSSWDPNANGDVNALAVSGNTVYVAGFFSAVGGMPRRYGIAAVDRTTGSLMDWDPQSDNWVGTLAVMGSTVFVGGRFNSVGGQSRANLAALDAATGAATGWTANTNSFVYALATIGDTLYVGGNFFSIGGQARNGLAAVDINTGAVLPWNLDLSSAEWWSSVTYPIVWGLTAAGTTLYVGGRFGRAGNTPAASLAAISFAPQIPTPAPTPMLLTLSPIMPNPVRARATIRYALPLAGPVSLAVFDVQGRRVASLLNQVAQTAGWHEVSMRAEGWSEGFYFCRLETRGVNATRKMVILR